MAKIRKSLALFLAIVMVVTFTMSGIVLPTSAEVEAATESTSNVVYSEDFEGDHAWKQGGAVVEATADGENNKAVLLTGSAKTYTSPTFNVDIKKSERYLIRFKLKSVCATDGQEDGIMTFFYNSTSSDGSPQNATMSLKANTGYTSAKYTIPNDEYIWIQEMYTASKDATSLHIGVRSSTNGKMDLLMDDVSVIHCEPETEIVPNGDFEGEGHVGMLTDLYSRRAAEVITEEDGNKALKINGAGLTYFRMQGMKTGRLYDVKLRYKGKVSQASYAAGCTYQKIVDVKTSASTAWRDYHLYIATNNANNQYIGFYPTEGMIIDDLTVREIRMELGESKELFVGKELALEPTVRPELTKAPTMKWTTSDETIATVNAGVVTGIAPGEVTITLQNNASKTMDTCTVTVKEAPKATAIQLDQTEATVVKDNTLALNVTALPEGAETPTITWTSSDEEVATVVDGVVTPVWAGTAVITAMAEGLAPVSCMVTVESKNYLTNGDFEAGSTAAWGNNTNIQEGVGKDNSWGIVSARAENAGTSTAGPSTRYKNALLSKLKPGKQYILSFDYKNTGGGGGQLYFDLLWGTTTAGKEMERGYDLPKGEVAWRTITIAFTTPETISTNGGWEFNVRSIGAFGTTWYDNFSLVEKPLPIKATAIELDQTEATVLVGKTLTLSASALPKGAELPEIVWTSSNNDIATVADGVVTAVAEGDVEITATAEGLVPVTCVVTVEPLPTATQIVLDQTKLSLQEDSTAKLTATWIPEVAQPTIVWASSNEQVVTVVDGELTAVAAGVATITASAEGLDIAPAECRVTVTAKNLIKNGDFEDGATAWAAGSTYIKESGGVDDSGAYVLSYTHDGSANKQITLRYGGTNLTSLKPNTTYVLSFDYKSYGAGFSRLSCWTNGIGDKAFTENGWSKSLPHGKKDWTHYTLTFTTLDEEAIAAANKAYILYFEYVMYANADGTGTGNFMVDNIALNTAPVTASAVVLDKTAESITIGDTVTLTPSFLPVGAPSADVTWATADDTIATVDGGVVTGISAGATTITATAKDMEPATFQVKVETKNLFVNGDYEQGASVNWGSSAIVKEGVGKGGSIGLVSVRGEGNGDWDAGSGQYYKATLLSKLKPGTKYVLSFDYKNTGKGGGQLYFNADFGTTEGGTRLNTGITAGLPKGEVEWRTIYITFTTPETITGASGGWEFNPRSLGQAGTTWYDNFCLVEADTAGIGMVYTDVAVDEGEVTFTPSGEANEAETLKEVESGTEVTVEVTPQEGYLMVPGSLQYTCTLTGQVTKILNKELTFNSENFGSETFSGDTFTFTMPKGGADVTAKFVPISEQNFAMDTVGTGLRTDGENYDGIRFLTRMNMAFSFNEIAAQDTIAMTVKMGGVDYTVKELGSMIVRKSDKLDVEAMTPENAETYWKKSVAYRAGGDMTLLDYTNRYIDFTVVVTKGANIEAEDFEAREYSARGYIVLEDAEGQTKTVMCDNVMTNSVNNAQGKIA